MTDDDLTDRLERLEDRLGARETETVVIRRMVVDKNGDPTGEETLLECVVPV